MIFLKDDQEKEAIEWMFQAAKRAGKALCLRAKCGTVIVKDGKIISEGYNAPPLDSIEHRMCQTELVPGKQRYDKTCCMHAEWRAIMDALKTNSQAITGSTLYFTRVDEKGNIIKSGKPFCTVCSRAALDVGIAWFVLWHEEGLCLYATDEYNRLSYQYKE